MVNKKESPLSNILVFAEPGYYRLSNSKHRECKDNGFFLEYCCYKKYFFTLGKREAEYK